MGTETVLDVVVHLYRDAWSSVLEPLLLAHRQPDRTDLEAKTAQEPLLKTLDHSMSPKGSDAQASSSRSRRRAARIHPLSDDEPEEEAVLVIQDSEDSEYSDEKVAASVSKGKTPLRASKRKLTAQQEPRKKAVVETPAKIREDSLNEWQPQGISLQIYWKNQA